MTRKYHKTQGFTLIELLVVIGIIAVIAGLAVPTLFSARRSANELKCAVNLRGLHGAAMQYSERKRGAFPFARAQDARAHDSLNALLSSREGRELTPELFMCPESGLGVAFKDEEERGAGFLLDDQTNSYAWIVQRVQNTKKAWLASDKYVQGIDYGDGEEHGGHIDILQVLDTSGRVHKVDVNDPDDQAKFGLDNDELLPTGLTR